MMEDTHLLVGRDGGRTTLETHAARLRSRGLDVRVATYGHEPDRDLRGSLPDAGVALPATVAHTRDTLGAVAAALPSQTCYAEPVGRSPAFTRALAARARAEIAPAADVSLALVALGASGEPYERQVAAYHAARLRERTDYGEVTVAYLHRNPAAECLRYETSGDRTVVVPLFVTPCEATDQALPDLLELDRGGLAYADPPGDHPAVTDAMAGGFAAARALAAAEVISPGPNAPPLAADGGE